MVLVLRASLIIIIYAFNDPQILHLGHLIRAAVAPPPPFTFTVKEKLNVALNQFGGISSFNLVGTLSLQTLTQDDDGFLLVQVLIRLSLLNTQHHSVSQIFILPFLIRSIPGSTNHSLRTRRF